MGRFRVDKVTKLVEAFFVIAGDTHDVAMVLRHQIGVFIDERLPHARRVFLIHTKDNRLGHPIAALL